MIPWLDQVHPVIVWHTAIPPIKNGGTFCSALLCGLAWVACAWSGQPIVLHDVTGQTGITFRHTDGSCGNYYIVEAMSAGLALFDYDGDGDVDIYFLNGAPFCDGASAAPVNALYRNDGGWKFTDVTARAGVGDHGFALGVAVGDYDNDGYPDLYVNNCGSNVLYRNQGDGTFVDVTRRAGVDNGQRVGAGTCFLDFDADGDLDLYVANYVRFTYENHVPRTKQGYPIYGPPSDYPAEADTLYRNNGDGTFTDVSAESGIGLHPAPSMGMVCADYDRDGDTDIFVANDGQANTLLQNNGRGKFAEIGLLSGFAYDATGKVHASMGVDCGDYDNDGYLDFHVTSFQGELATLYRNVAGKVLEDVTQVSGAGSGTRAPVTWGNGVADFDNDGLRDIFIACGHLYDQLEHFDQSSRYECPNLLLRNLGSGKFANESRQSGDGMDVALSSRGLGIDDLDNDGDLDVVILNSRREPTLLRNETRSPNHWIDVRLHGTRTNRDGVGARVEVQLDQLTLVDEVHSGRGYQSHFGSRLHFGLGTSAHVRQIRVHWLGGGVDVLRDVPVDRVIDIVESTRR